MKNDFYRKVESLLAGNSDSPTLVHCDIFKAKAVVGKIENPRKLLDHHVDTLSSLLSGAAIYFPTFNYDFTKSGVYDVQNDKSQVGILTEYVRLNRAIERKGPPVFNFCGLQQQDTHIRESGEVDPFDTHSLFAELYRKQGQVLMYGADLSSLTCIHYIESRSGGPVYRYDKFFKGVVKYSPERSKDVTLQYHVRPMGRHLEYDWPRLFEDCLAQGVITTVKGEGSQISRVDFVAISNYWQQKLLEDPLFLLDAQSRNWVAPMLEKTGRRFEQADFE